MNTTCTEIKKLKGEWKVLFNASYKFYTDNGVDHEAAQIQAFAFSLESIRRKMKLAKTLKFKF